jgi:hypothetical protein
MRFVVHDPVTAVVDDEGRRIAPACNIRATSIGLSRSTAVSTGQRKPGLTCTFAESLPASESAESI